MVSGFQELLADAFMWRAATRGRAPSYHRLLEVLEELLRSDAPAAGVIRERIRDAWSGRSFRIFYDRPLLLLAALRFDALKQGPEHPLWAALAAEAPDPEAARTDALVAALARPSVWESIRTRYVQTNETSRAVAWLWPAKLAGCDGGARPLALVEVGCAAGLNLVADALPAPWTDAGGAALQVVEAPAVALRLGLDVRPLDVFDDDAVAWMCSCIWAGDRARLQRLDAAVSAFRAAPARLEACDAVAAPARLGQVTAGAPPDSLVMAFQTIVRDYFDPATAAAYARGMRDWLAANPPGRALWLELELAPDNSDPAHMAGVYAHVAERDGTVRDLLLARTSYHPTDVVVDDAAVGALQQALR